MAGHSKWANIQHHKGIQDAKRGKLFTKLIREITVAAKIGGGDPNANPRLRLAIDKGLNANMSKDTIERAVKRGAGGMEGQNVEEVRYEGYGPGGVAMMVDCLTDNRNRTVGEVRHAFTKFGGNLGAAGSVAYLFSKKGQFTYAPGSDENKIMEAALEVGAEDVQRNEDGSIDVLCLAEDFEKVKAALVEKNLAPAGFEVAMLPATRVALDLETAKSLLKLQDALEECDDVQNVYSNADFPNEV